MKTITLRFCVGETVYPVEWFAPGGFFVAKSPHTIVGLNKTTRVDKGRVTWNTRRRDNYPYISVHTDRLIFTTLREATEKSEQMNEAIGLNSGDDNGK
jgi:hypothetical protein